MTLALNETHDPARQSFVDSANAPGCDFPIQNLPFGVFRAASGAPPRVGVAIGDQIFDVAAAVSSFRGPAADAARTCAAPVLNDLMAMPAQSISALRLALSRGLSADHGNKALSQYLVPMTQTEILVPVEIGDFTDFYASVFHATNVGRMLRPDNPLMPNYKYLPVAYHGRSSSVRVSGTPVKRPQGQRKRADETAPTYGPSRNLDFELELGFYIGAGSKLGDTIPVGRAGEHIFGFCLLNDWSARDVQGWEYQPLGPFLAKNFGTTVSPWVVTREALLPYRVPAFSRPQGDPAPLPHLFDATDQGEGGFDITMEAYVATDAMRRGGLAPQLLSRTSFANVYWTVAQMVAHHASNGCDLMTGDLLGSGTVSGPDKTSLGSLLEISMRGAEPVKLPTGEQRAFIEDGDEIIFRGYAQKSGFARIGFGECRAVILPAG
jgi:fumarylacetoacetase